MVQLWFSIIVHVLVLFMLLSRKTGGLATKCSSTMTLSSLLFIALEKSQLAGNDTAMD